MIKTIGNATATYKFTPKYVLKAGQKVTVWASDAGVISKPPTDLIWKNESSWGSGMDVHVVLSNPQGEEVAKRTTTYRTAVERQQSDDDDDNGVEAIEEDVFHQQRDLRSARRGCSIM